MHRMMLGAKRKLSEMPSLLWLIVIAIGGIMVVVGNTYYPQARDREKGKILEDQAISLIKTELTYNINVISNILDNLNVGGSDAEKLRTSSWEVVSKGTLILNINPDTTNKLMNIYSMTNQINDLNSRLLEALVGPSAILPGGAETRRSLSLGLQRIVRNTADAIKDSQLVSVPDTLTWSNLSPSIQQLLQARLPTDKTSKDDDTPLPTMATPPFQGILPTDTDADELPPPSH